MGAVAAGLTVPGRGRRHGGRCGRRRRRRRGRRRLDLPGGLGGLTLSHCRDRRLVDGRDLKGLFPACRLAHVEAGLPQDLSARVASRGVVVDVQENRAGDVHGQEPP